MSIGPEIVINGRFEFEPDALAAVRNAMAVMQAASRAEDGCQDYTFSIEMDAPTVVRLTERWDDMAALEGHFAMPHMATYREAMAANPPMSREVYFFEVTEVSPPTV